jgi:hypothetical protein
MSQTFEERVAQYKAWRDAENKKKIALHQMSDGFKEYKEFCGRDEVLFADDEKFAAFYGILYSWAEGDVTLVPQAREMYERICAVFYGLYISPESNT